MKYISGAGKGRGNIHPKPKSVVEKWFCFLGLYKMTNFLGNRLEMVKINFSLRFSCRIQNFLNKFQILIDLLAKSRKVLTLDFLISLRFAKDLKNP